MYHCTQVRGECQMLIQLLANRPITCWKRAKLWTYSLKETPMRTLKSAWCVLSFRFFPQLHELEFVPNCGAVGRETYMYFTFLQGVGFSTSDRRKWRWWTTQPMCRPPPFLLLSISPSTQASEARKWDCTKVQLFWKDASLVLGRKWLPILVLTWKRMEFVADCTPYCTNGEAAVYYDDPGNMYGTAGYWECTCPYTNSSGWSIYRKCWCLWSNPNCECVHLFARTLKPVDIHWINWPFFCFSTTEVHWVACFPHLPQKWAARFIQTGSAVTFVYKKDVFGTVSATNPKATNLTPLTAGPATVSAHAALGQIRWLGESCILDNSQVLIWHTHTHRRAQQRNNKKHSRFRKRLLGIQVYGCFQTPLNFRNFSQLHNCFWHNSKSHHIRKKIVSIYSGGTVSSSLIATHACCWIHLRLSDDTFCRHRRVSDHQLNAMWQGMRQYAGQLRLRRPLLQRLRLGRRHSHVCGWVTAWCLRIWEWMVAMNHNFASTPPTELFFSCAF